MGCASSKEKVCRNCQAPYMPVRRSFSVHLKPKRTVDSNHHLVSLTSSTMGSLNLDALIQIHDLESGLDQIQGVVAEDQNAAEKGEILGTRNDKEEFTTTMIKAKTWSDMIDKKIPKIAPRTPIRTPPGEPETINVWELMEGLDDISPLRQVHHFRSFSFHVSGHGSPAASIDDQATPRLIKEAKDAPADTDSDLNSNDTSLVSEFDPEVISSFRRALEVLPPANPFPLKPLESDLQPTDMIASRGKERLIVYFTSLRGVRKTYEDCCHVQVILKGLGVKVDERDVSMHSGFKDELRELLSGEPFWSLPRVFLGKKHIGGVEEIQRLNEEGKLEKMVENCETWDEGSDSACNACGGIRFVPCGVCSGSCKIFYDGDYGGDDDEEDVCEGSEHEYGFRRCPECNENGLIRCPICCD